MTELLRQVFEDQYQSNYNPRQQGKWDNAFDQCIKNSKKLAGFEKKTAEKDIMQWDCNLLCKVITNIFNLSQNLVSDVDQIRKLRNEYYGHRPDFFTTDKQLSDFINDLNPHVQALSRPNDTEFQDAIKSIKECGTFGNN